MSYEKQTWNKYDDMKTEEENIQNGAVVTDNRMNHIEEGIESNDKANSSQAQSINKHIADTANPHKVTATQIGLDKVDNIQQAAKTDFDSHVKNKTNPHAVTASQVGAYSKMESDTKFATVQSVNNLSTALKSKAEDSNVVHKTGDETISGKKTFTDTVSINNLEVVGDIPWTNILPINGFSLTPSTGATGVLKYKVQHGVLYVSARGVVLPSLSAATPTAFIKLPFEVPQNATAGFIGQNLSTSLYAKEVCTIQSTGTDTSILYSKNSSTTAGDRFSVMFIVPMD